MSLVGVHSAVDLMLTYIVDIDEEVDHADSVQNDVDLVEWAILRTLQSAECLCFV